MNAHDTYRDATFSVHTRVKLELAYNLLSRVPSDAWADVEIDLAGAVSAVREVCDSWDANDATGITA